MSVYKNISLGKAYKKEHKKSMFEMDHFVFEKKIGVLLSTRHVVLYIITRVTKWSNVHLVTH